MQKLIPLTAAVFLAFGTPSAQAQDGAEPPVESPAPTGSGLGPVEGSSIDPSWIIAAILLALVVAGSSGGGGGGSDYTPPDT